MANRNSCAFVAVACAWALGCGGETQPVEPPEPSCVPGASCSSVQSDCLALVDNAKRGKAGLRVAQLTITRPSVLADGIVARQVAKRIELDMPECNLGGNGTFSWLVEIDRDSGTVRTGGSPPRDPRNGYCFVNATLGGREVRPVEVQAELNGSDFSVVGFDVVLPIYLDEEGKTFVLLPLREVRVTEGRVSKDFNCVGRYDADSQDPALSCVATPPEHLAFENGAKLDAFITLEDADTVDVPILGSSLCVVLSGDAASYGDGQKPTARCRRDGMGAILLQGDWCSTTDAPDGCRDAYKLGAELAASAVEIEGECP